MRNTKALCTIAFAVCLSSSFAYSQVTVNVFGPESFFRSTSEPRLETRDFSLHRLVHGPFVIVVSNRSPDGSNRVSSARISVNGVQVFGPSDFDQQVPELQSQVSLVQQNMIDVELGSKPGSFLRVAIAGQIDSDKTVTESTQPINANGGILQLPGIAAFTVPPGATLGGNITIASVESPFMEFLAESSDSAISLLPVTKIRIKSSTPLTKRATLKIQAPHLSTLVPTGEKLVFVFLNRQMGSDGEQIDELVPNTSDPCQDDAACVTILPDWFQTANAADPTDPVIELTVAARPENPTTFHLWTVDNVNPQTQTPVSVDPSQDLTFSATVTLEKDFDFQLPLAFFESPCSGLVISQPPDSVCRTSGFLDLNAVRKWSTPYGRRSWHQGYPR